MYGVDNALLAEQTGEITALIQKINRQISTEAALQVFAQGCLEFLAMVLNHQAGFGEKFRQKQSHI